MKKRVVEEGRSGQDCEKIQSFDFSRCSACGWLLVWETCLDVCSLIKLTLQLNERLSNANDDGIKSH